MPIHATQIARSRARVTVITRTKNRPLLLGRCIRSVLGQTCRDWLHVIVNDGGNPRILHSLVREHQDAYAGRVEVIEHPTCKGMQNASNRGLEAAAGEFVTIHDDDDSWEPDFLRACVKFLDAAGMSSITQGVITQTSRVLEEFNAHGGVDEIGREDYLPVQNIELFAAGADNPFAPIAFVYRRAVHEQIGFFNEQFSVVGDWDFNLRFLAYFEIGVIDQRLANYHWRHRSGGDIYANTVTDGRDEHARKTAELRNHHLRADLRAGHLGLGYLINSARLMHGHSSLLWDLRNRSDQTAHGMQKVQNRLRHWEWLFTRNRRLKAPSNDSPTPQGAQSGAHGNKRGSLQARSCHEALTAGLNGKPPPRVLSLDVFDTALRRLVGKPIDVFLLLAPLVRRELGVDPELPFSTLRVSAERVARSRKFTAHGHEEVSLAEIYEVFCELADVEPSMHRDRLLELELSAEATLLYPDPAVLSAASAAERAGTRVIFVSDMYLPHGFIVNQLRRAGYQVEEGSLFLSSEHAASKHHGGLFDQVLGSLRCAPDEVLHVGDNFHSDVERARERGMKTVHWDTGAGNLPPKCVALVDQRKGAAPPVIFADDDLLSSLCAGLSRRSSGSQVDPQRDKGENDALWDQLGYEVGGPLYFTFLRWLLRHARLEGRKRLFFLARDGHYLRRACDFLTAASGVEIQAVEMAASRRLLNLPQITAFDHSAWQFLLTPNPNLQVRHFLTRLGLDAESLTAEIRRAGFAGPDEVVTTAGGVFRSEADHRAMRALFLSLEKPILAQAAVERELIERYFAQIELIPGQAAEFAVIDVGWQASSARALQTLFNRRSKAAGHEHCTLRAFYFGTWHFARAAVEAGCDLSSFFFHLDKPASRRVLVHEAVELIELFFGAPHPTIVGLREGAAGRIEPSYGSHEHGDEHQRCLTRMRERAVDFVRDVATLAPAKDLLDWPGAGLGYLEAVLERLLRHPSVEEARTLGALPARDSFGGSSPSRPIAQPPGRMDRWLHPARLSQAYQRAFWKRGFLAQLSPREALRAQAAAR